MFRNTPAAEPASDHDVDVVMVPAELVPLSHLTLDLPAPELGGWHVYLTSRDIPIVLDDLGRSAVSRDDARRLFDEHRENEVRKAEMRAAAERAAVESDQQWRSQLPAGIPWYEIQV